MDTTDSTYRTGYGVDHVMAISSAANGSISAVCSSLYNVMHINYALLITGGQIADKMAGGLRKTGM